jgi:hypothetical protein
LRGSGYAEGTLLPWTLGDFSLMDAVECGIVSKGGTYPAQLQCKTLADRCHLTVEINGYRREDAKEKKSTMDSYWVPGLNNLGNQGRWAFAEFTDVFQMQADFAQKVQEAFD